MWGRRYLFVDGNIVRRGLAFAQREKKPTDVAAEVFAQIVLRVVGETQPTHMVFVADSPEAWQWRAERVKAYNATAHPEARVDPYPQAPDCRAVLETASALCAALGFCVLPSRTREARDTIASLLEHVPEDAHATILSNDKTLRVLLTRPDTQIVLFQDLRRREKLLTCASVEADMRVRVHLIPDWLALVGDPHGVPGVPGIGEKAASVLIGDMGDLTGIYYNLDAVPRAPLRNAGRVAQLLSDHRGRAVLSRELATLDRTQRDLPTLEPRLPISRDRLQAAIQRFVMRINNDLAAFFLGEEYRIFSRDNPERKE